MSSHSSRTPTPQRSNKQATTPIKKKCNLLTRAKRCFLRLYNDKTFFWIMCILLIIIVSFFIPEYCPVDESQK